MTHPTKPRNTTADQGYLDGFDGKTLSGWAWDGGDGFHMVDILLDGRRIGKAVADQYRADLKAAGIADGCRAFRFDLPDGLLTGQRQTLSARLSESGRELNGSPLEIMGFDDDATAPSPDTDLTCNPALAGAAEGETVLRGGLHEAAPGLWLEAVGETPAEVRAARAIIDGLGGTTAGMRFEMPDPPPAHASPAVRLIHAWRPFPYVLAGPLTLTFTLAGSEAGRRSGLSVGIGMVRDGALILFWTTAVRRIPPGTQQVAVAVDAPVLNAAAGRCRAEGGRAVAVVEFRGTGTVTLSPPGLRLGRQHPDAAPTGLRDFEDPAIRAQWTALQRPVAPARPTAITADGSWICADILNVPEIIVPIFNAPQAVAGCLAAIRAATPRPHLLTLVDDGSLEETARLLDSAAAGNPWVRVMRSGRNEGYTRAVNRAVTSSAGHVVVILNSDALVTHGWLDGLLECLETGGDGEAATMIAGPMSNAASWQSVPWTRNAEGWAVHALGPEETPEDRARLLRTVSRRIFPAVPILNGFCLAIRRRLFEDIGLFDEHAFPDGYGEENDFCLRAADAGFAMRVADHVYVHHLKSQSFGTDRRNALTARANTILTVRYGRARLHGIEETMAAQPDLAAVRHAFEVAFARSGGRDDR
ncbi:glycosyltransferase family 2 protein [Azospirillum thiophilum]|uniref:glycosyltransferase family 2 protein n=1 Tax=Azospirillum thiophilum TaxID=528244 RepID=UPI000698F22B|nr:glycosyltransferase family 2 protein [Azospirillum thiophilum]